MRDQSQKERCKADEKANEKSVLDMIETVLEQHRERCKANPLPLRPDKKNGWKLNLSCRHRLLRDTLHPSCRERL